MQLGHDTWIVALTRRACHGTIVSAPKGQAWTAAGARRGCRQRGNGRGASWIRELLHHRRRAAGRERRRPAVVHRDDGAAVSVLSHGAVGSGTPAPWRKPEEDRGGDDRGRGLGGRDDSVRLHVPRPVPRPRP